MRLLFAGLAVMAAVFLVVKSQNSPTITANASSITLEEVKSLADLATVEMPMEVIVPAMHSETILGFIPQEAKLLLIAPTSVKAGFNLSNAKIDGDSLQLPSPTILDAKVKVESLQVYDFKKDALIGDGVAPELQTLAQKEARQKAVIAACNGGILKMANDRANSLSEILKIPVKTVEPKECGLK